MPQSGRRGACVPPRVAVWFFGFMEDGAFKRPKVPQQWGHQATVIAAHTRRTGQSRSSSRARTPADKGLEVTRLAAGPRPFTFPRVT